MAEALIVAARRNLRDEMQTLFEGLAFECLALMRQEHDEVIAVTEVIEDRIA